jgi:hypothetical protein
MTKTMVIPFKEFMKGNVGPRKTYSSFLLGITPFAGFEKNLDGGLIFFIGIGAVLVGLALLEKYGIAVNEAAVKWVLAVSFFLGIFYLLILKNPVWLWV